MHAVTIRRTIALVLLLVVGGVTLRYVLAHHQEIAALRHNPPVATFIAAGLVVILLAIYAWLLIPRPSRFKMAVAIGVSLAACWWFRLLADHLRGPIVHLLWVVPVVVLLGWMNLRHSIAPKRVQRSDWWITFTNRKGFRWMR